MQCFNLSMLYDGEVYEAECTTEFGQIFELIVTDGYGNEIVDGMIHQMMEQMCLCYAMDEEATVRDYDDEEVLH